jgi:hypothetical protein
MCGLEGGFGILKAAEVVESMEAEHKRPDGWSCNHAPVLGRCWKRKKETKPIPMPTPLVHAKAGPAICFPCPQTILEFQLV